MQAQPASPTRTETYQPGFRFEFKARYIIALLMIGVIVFVLMRRVLGTLPSDRMRGYRLFDDESLPTGIRRILLELLDSIIELLRNVNANPDEAVHETRKNFKKARAVLRLVRDEIGDEAYFRENICYRDAARMLSAVRDSAVIVESLDALRETFAEELTPDAFIRLRENLVTEHEHLRDQIISVDNAPQTVIDILESARQRLSDLPLEHDDFSAISGGLRRVYRRGIRRMVAARKNPTAERLHDWRKRVKYLWYQMHLLESNDTEPPQEFEAGLDTLSDLLGLEHDLAELQQLAQEKPHYFTSSAEQELLLALIQRQRCTLQTQAYALGSEIYTEKPDDFLQRMQDHWPRVRESAALEPSGS